MPAHLPSPPPPAKGTRERDVWIDLLRGFAVVIMLETHCVNELLHPGAISGNTLTWLHFFNGLAAPTFLWIAGYLQGMVIRRGIAVSCPLLIRRRLRRLFSIHLLGLFLQIPWHAWLQGDFSLDTWRALATVNILQCLAVSICVLLLLGASAPSLYDRSTVLITLVVLSCASSARGWHSGWMPLDAWLNRDSGSFFPIFPWFAFAAAGSLMSRWSSCWKTWTPLAALMMVGGDWLQRGPFDETHPGFFAERLGYVLLFAVLVHVSAKFIQASWLQLIGRQSLFIYVLHLLILHALPLPGGTPATLWGDKLDLPTTTAAFVLLLFSCIALANVKEQHKKMGAAGESIPATPR